MSNSQSSQPVHRRTSSRGKSSSIKFLRNINCNFNMLKAQLFSRNIGIKIQLCQRRLDQSGDGATVDPRDTPLPRHRLWQNGHIQLLNRRISRSQRLLAQGLCVVALVFSFLAGFFNSESHREMASQSLQIFTCLYASYAARRMDKLCSLLTGSGCRWAHSPSGMFSFPLPCSCTS